MFQPDPGRDRRSPSATRIFIWVAVSAVGVYLVVSGIIGIVGAHG